MRKVAVIGSSGAIGSAFVDHYINDQSINSIFSFSRSSIGIDNNKVKHFSIDIENENSVQDAAKSVEEINFDEIIIASGLLHTNEFGPEKSIKDLKADNILKILNVNTVGPAIIGKHFLPLLNKNNKSVMAFLSARVGSISENKLGGWYAYRASKSALNQIIKTFSIELKRTNPKAIIIGLQPGTVESELSAPFKRSVSKNKLFSAEYSASQLIGVIERVDESSSGNLISWEGEIISP
ncbi:SDR family NAD(P)-dependent oxidoreductase [Gammaproteobacteria bacterium]|nr:SDR family NAD(P)-dependent oxidoreductase [Gammaproteobacteria bacterium]